MDMTNRSFGFTVTPVTYATTVARPTGSLEWAPASGGSLSTLAFLPFDVFLRARFRVAPLETMAPGQSATQRCDTYTYYDKNLRLNPSSSTIWFPCFLSWSSRMVCKRKYEQLGGKTFAQRRTSLSCLSFLLFPGPFSISFLFFI